MQKKKARDDLVPSFYKQILFSVYANLTSAVRNVLKFNFAVDESKQSVVSTTANVVAGMNMGASLANNDIAGDDSLSVSLLYTKALGLTVASVLRRTYTFFMSKKL